MPALSSRNWKRTNCFSTPKAHRCKLSWLLFSRQKAWSLVNKHAFLTLPVLARSGVDADGPFPSAGVKGDHLMERKSNVCRLITVNFGYRKNNERRQKQVSIIAQQVLMMGWQVFVPQWRQQAAFLSLPYEGFGDKVRRATVDGQPA